MMRNKPNISYPSPQDLEFILKDSVKKADLEAFLRARGVYLFNATTDSIAREISAMMLDVAALETLRRLAYRNSNKKILSGFSLSSSQDFDLDQIYMYIRNNGTLTSEGYSLNTISKISNGELTYYEGSITYTRKSAGRVSFIREEQREASFIMKKTNDKEWQVEVDGSKSHDGKAVFHMLEKISKEYGICINSLRIDKLTRTQTITFFDLLAQRGLSSEWVIKDIGRITIRQNAETKDDEECLNGEETEVSQDYLSGITQAILEGMNLREHDFVKKAESQGYAFTSMTYTFNNQQENVNVVLRAEFKGNPKIFEVALESYQLPIVNQDEGFEEAMSTLEDKDNMKIRSEFWNNAQSIYYGLISSHSS